MTFPDFGKVNFEVIFVRNEKSNVVVSEVWSSKSNVACLIHPPKCFPNRFQKGLTVNPHSFVCYHSWKKIFLPPHLLVKNSIHTNDKFSKEIFQTITNKFPHRVNQILTKESNLNPAKGVKKKTKARCLAQNSAPVSRGGIRANSTIFFFYNLKILNKKMV